MSVDDMAERRAAFVAELVEQGDLYSPAWREAFRAVPRHLFLPRFFRQTADGQRQEAIDRQHPEWLDLIYRNSVLATQLEGDDEYWRRAHDNGPVQGTATSSSTQPSLMAEMLEALGVCDGDRVLEVGTGTGYNAGLLCHRLGAQLVTSIEYDAAVAGQAKRALAGAGHRPTLVVGDGADGHAPGAPYDRLIATYAVGDVPSAWLAQVRPGGVIVTSLYRELGVGLLARLVVDDDGNAHGRLLDDSAYFMPTRRHRATQVWRRVRSASTRTGERHESILAEPLGDEPSGWTALAGLLLPGVARLDLFREDGQVQWLVHADGSWAYYEARTGQVEQAGPQRLWTRLEDVHSQWQRLGQPARDRLGLTVTGDGVQRVWLDEPPNTVAEVRGAVA